MPKKKRRLQHILIATRTVALIHQAVREAPNLNAAAMQLGVGDVTLGSHLSKFILDREVLNFDRFKQVTIERARQIWGVDYDRAMLAPLIDIKNYTGAYIHEVSRGVTNIRVAATQLAVRDHTLSRYLRKFIYNGKKLDFNTFKALSDVQVREVFGSLYEPLRPEQRRNLTPTVHGMLPDLAIAIDTEQDSFDMIASLFTHQFSPVNGGLHMHGLFSQPFTTLVVEEPNSKRCRTDLDFFLDTLSQDMAGIS